MIARRSVTELIYGADIKLGNGVAELGGLHVIVSERHESGRIDRQLAGRCSRQGDPGSVRTYGSLEDDLLLRYAPQIFLKLLSKATSQNRPQSNRLAENLLSLAQHKAQRQGKKVFGQTIGLRPGL